MSETEFTVFYAWESERPAPDHRTLIESAARAALGRLKADVSLEIDPRLDKDTSDVPGTPAITDTILSKIENSDLFLWDATLVMTSSTGRAAPNPNVLIELGFAAAKIGWEFIIAVMNEQYGGFSKLPFDLKYRRRPIPYRLAPGASDEDRSRVEAELTERLEEAFRGGLAAAGERRRWSPVGRAVAHRLRDAVMAGTNPIAAILASKPEAERAPMWAMLLYGRSAPDRSDPPDRVAAAPILAAVIAPMLLQAHPDPTAYARPLDELLEGFQSCAVLCRDALKDLGAHAPEPIVLALNELGTMLLRNTNALGDIFLGNPADVIVGRGASLLEEGVLMLLRGQRTWQAYLGS